VHLTWLVVSLLVLTAARPSEAQSVPLTYNAITDRNFYSESAPPSIGAAGFQFTDPAFGSKIVCVTDTNTEPGVTWHPTSGYSGPVSSEMNVFNTTSTMFYVLDTYGGQNLLFTFDPATMNVGRVPGATPDETSTWGGRLVQLAGSQFSYTDPDLMYGINAQNGNSQITQYKVSTNAYTVINDMTTCTGLGIGGMWGSGDLDISKDDQRLAAPAGSSLGPTANICDPGLNNCRLNNTQDNWNIMYVIDRTTTPPRCRWLNTYTGQVGGEWGPTGTVSRPYRFTMHNARISKEGRYLKMTVGHNYYTGPGSTEYYIWDVETTNVVGWTESGHQAVGYGKVLGGQGTAATGNDYSWSTWDMTSMADPLSNPLLLVNPPVTHMWVTDYHASWNNALSTTLAPICLSTYREDGAVAGSSPSSQSQGFWENEILCLRTDGVQFTTWRFAHHYSTFQYPDAGGCPPALGRTCTTFYDSPRGNVSQDGRFYMFASNWHRTRGSNDLGWRTDVFIVQLAGATTTTTITDDTDSFTGTAGTVLSSYRPGIWHHSDGSAFEIEVSTPTSGAAGAGQSLTAQLETNLRINPWANDQWAQITLNRLDTKSGGVVLRWNGTNGYAFGRDNNNHPDGYLIEKIDANLGTATVLAGPIGTPAVGDVIQARIQGSSLTLLVNGGTLLTATDATITSGQPGLFLIDWTAAGEQNLTAWSAGHFQ